eukprot:1147959-Pyramimonas_sp.AAC.1
MAPHAIKRLDANILGKKAQGHGLTSTVVPAVLRSGAWNKKSSVMASAVASESSPVSDALANVRDGDLLLAQSEKGPMWLEVQQTPGKDGDFYATTTGYEVHVVPDKKNGTYEVICKLRGNRAYPVQHMKRFTSELKRTGKYLVMLTIPKKVLSSDRSNLLGLVAVPLKSRTSACKMYMQLPFTVIVSRGLNLSLVWTTGGVAGIRAAASRDVPEAGDKFG